MLAVICKVHASFRQEKTAELIQHLSQALEWSPSQDPANSSLLAIQESALLYSGHLSVVLMQQNPVELVQSFQRVFQLNMERTLTSEMPSCIKSFVLPIAYSLTIIQDQGALLALLASLSQDKAKLA